MKGDRDTRRVPPRNEQLWWSDRSVTEPVES